MDRLGLICNRLAEIAIEDLGSDGQKVPRELDDLVCALSMDTGVAQDAIAADLLHRIIYLHAAKQVRRFGPNLIHEAP